MNIVDFDDSSNLINWSLTSSGSVTSPSIGSAGTVNGVNGTFSSLGFLTGDDGFINADSFTGFASLDAGCQVVFDVTTIGIVQRDNENTAYYSDVSGSTGAFRSFESFCSAC